MTRQDGTQQEPELNAGKIEGVEEERRQRPHRQNGQEPSACAIVTRASAPAPVTTAAGLRWWDVPGGAPERERRSSPEPLVRPDRQPRRPRRSPVDRRPRPPPGARR